MARLRTAHRAKCRAEGAQYVRNPGSLKPFRRIATLGAAVNATAAAVNVEHTPTTHAAFLTAVERLQAYRSRGHAKGGHVRHQLNFEDRSKYSPGAEDRKHALAEASV